MALTKITDSVSSLTGLGVSNTPAGNIAATTVQAAINELDTSKVETTFVTGLLGTVGTKLDGITTLFTSLGTAGQLLTSNGSLAVPTFQDAPETYVLPDITVAMLADGTDGELITWDANGVPATVAVGSTGQVLMSNGPGAAPTMQTLPIGSVWALDTGNVYAGTGSGISLVASSGNYNTFYGYQSGTATTTGDQNIAVGYRTLYTNTTGIDNVAVGTNTLYSNTTGVDNNAIGTQALYSTTTGSRNSAMGKLALYSNTTGGKNIAIGEESLYTNTSGNYNIALGYKSLYANTTASNNIAIGNEALDANTTGYANLAIGSSALGANTTGDGNIAIGVTSLFQNTTGLYNTAVGVSALSQNTTGTRNTAVGYDALSQNSTGDYNSAFGYQTLYYSTASVGHNAAFGYQALYNNTTGDYNSAFGSTALLANTTGSYNTAVGYNALDSNTTGISNTAVGTGALGGLVTYNNCTGLGLNAAVTGSDQVQLGDSATTTYVYGTVQARSDIRDKTNITDCSLGLSFINALRPVDYNWDYREDYLTEQDKIDGKNLNDVVKDGTKVRNRKHHGLIAQEVKTVLDTQGIDFGGYQDHSIKGGLDVKSIGYSELIAPMIKAIQTLSARVVELEARL